MEVLTQTIRHVSIVGSSPIIFVVAGVAILFLLIRREWLRVIFVVSSLGSGLYSAFIKSLFKLTRPNGYVSDGFIPWDRILKSEVYSFPSTHVVLYTAFFGYLVYLSYRLKGVSKLTRHTVRIFSATMVIFVGSSRVLLGAHYAKDIVAGYIFGLIYLVLVIAGERFLAQKLSNIPPKRKKR